LTSTGPTAVETLTDPPAPTGRIDIHCHLIPGVDDGCRDFADSLACIRRLMAAGFTGSICTPHIIPGEYPQNLPQHLVGWTIQLRQAIQQAGLKYQVWPGGEVRLYDGLIKWLNLHGVPTLAGSRCVLLDFFDDRWPNWVTGIFQWLIDRGYQPILAHPERLGDIRRAARQLAQAQEMGVWLQGNTRCMTGEEGYNADQAVRQLLGEDRYQFMALDLHRPDSLEARLDGMALVGAEFGPQTLDRLTITAPRQFIFGQPGSLPTAADASAHE
jgi:protein-tyrosine phosphatase